MRCQNAEPSAELWAKYPSFNISDECCSAAEDKPEFSLSGTRPCAMRIAFSWAKTVEASAESCEEDERAGLAGAATSSTAAKIAQPETVHRIAKRCTQGR